MKKTAVAPSNIAFIKYWGKKDAALRLPSHSNISMNLSTLLTTTTVEFNTALGQDDILINEIRDAGEAAKVSLHLDRLRKMAGVPTKAKVVSVNNFPSSTGLSSSASGFAALTVAGAAALDLHLSQKALSILARVGSGSACRSIPDGFVEWLAGTDSPSSYAVSLYPPDYWDIRDIVVVASRQKKDVATTEGHKLAPTSPFYAPRLEKIGYKIALCKKYLREKDFTAFGTLIENEALEMHAVMITSTPPLIYWLPTTINLMKTVQQMRREGVEAYFTINTGQDVHVICQKKDEKRVIGKLQDTEGVIRIIPNSPAAGTRLVEDHLF